VGNCSAVLSQVYLVILSRSLQWMCYSVIFRIFNNTYFIIKYIIYIYQKHFWMLKYKIFCLFWQFLIVLIVYYYKVEYLWNIKNYFVVPEVSRYEFKKYMNSHKDVKMSLVLFIILPLTTFWMLIYKYNSTQNGLFKS
jgi:hypothetical protein